MDELISVIIPVYNAAPYLENCLDSVLGQTYQNIEIVIVNDGSKDGSGAIAQSYAERWPGRIKYFYQDNSGVTTARINGVTKSSGAWIGFMDADDEIEPDMYERLLGNALKYNADISHCGHQTIVNNGERIHYFYNTGRLVRQDREEGLKELLDGATEPSLWNKLFKRDLLDQLINDDLMDRSIKYNEDLLMNYYLFREANSSVFADFCGYHYLARQSSATREGFRPEKYMDPVKVQEQILHTVEDRFEDIVWHRYLSCCISAYSWFIQAGLSEEANQELKRVLTSNRSKWKLLSRNEKIKIYGVLHCPRLYIKSYRIYEKHFQKKKYE